MSTPMPATLPDIAARAAIIATELETLTALPEWTDEQRSQFDSLNTELGGLEARKTDLEMRAALVAKARTMAATQSGDGAAATGEGRSFNFSAKPDDLYDLRSIRYGAPVSELRGRAKRVVESIPYITDENKQEAFRKLEHVSDPRGIIPGLVLRSTPAHVSAFHKGLAGAQAMWNDEERAAIREMEEFRAAMSLTDTNGGYGVPFTLDPTIIWTNDGTVNPVRQLARVVTITTDTWNGISSAGVTASYAAENAEVSDGSPTFAQPTIQTRMGRAFVQASIEITQDFQGLAGEILAAFADAKDRLQSTVYWSGSSGSNQPIGIETALNGGTSEVAQTTGEAMTVADIYKTQQALPPRYRMGPKVAWTAELSTINFMRQFATANNYHAFLTDLGGGQPAQLLGYPLYEWSAMDAYSAVNASATAVNHLLLIGDWSNYVIADRVGSAVEFIPHLFATNANLPSGTRGWFYYWRDGADSVNDAAFRLFTLTTAA